MLHSPDDVLGLMDAGAEGVIAGVQDAGATFEACRDVGRIAQGVGAFEALDLNRLKLAAVEKEHGGRWEEFRDVHGDWGRDVALYLGRQAGRMGLRRLAENAGGLGTAACDSGSGDRTG